ncbi:phosphate ABC transporter permease PstA, partial [Listeria monocytogenes]
MNVKTKDKIATGVFYAIAVLIVIILAGLLGYILVKGVPQLSWKFLTTPPQSFQAGGGIGPEIWNSFYMLVITMIISVPISLGAGIYMAEYARKNWITDLIRTTIEVLSSLPSIVVGLFGFLVFVIQMGWSFSVISGALTLTIFNLPLLIRVVEEALNAIPNTQREAGLALGLSRWETITRVLVP